MGATQLGVAVPNFWFAMLLVLLFAVTLRWFSGRRLSRLARIPGWRCKALTLPAVALALPQASILARVMRSSLLDTLSEDYIRTARAKGLTEGQTLWRHALRNALIPVLTIIGLQFSFLLAGRHHHRERLLPARASAGWCSRRITQRDLIVVQVGGDAAGLRGDPRHLPRRHRLCAGRSAAAEAAR